MKKNLKIILISVILILSCASTKKSLRMWDNENSPKKLNRHKSYFNELFEKYSENIEWFIEKRESNLIKYRDYEFDNKSLVWNIKINNKETFESLTKGISPIISPDGKFLVSWKRNKSRYNAQDRFNYSLRVFHLKTKSQKELFETNEKHFIINELKYYPTMGWAPFGNIFVFIAQYKRINNVFIAVVEYDKTEQEIKYSIMQLTDNKEEDNFFYDPHWSNDGNFLSFSHVDTNNNSKVFIYDFENHKLEQFGKNYNIRSFRFGSKHNKSAFFVLKEESIYKGYYLKDFLKSKNLKKKIYINQCDFTSSYIFANFSEFSTKIAVLVYDENIRLVIYDYKKDRVYNFKLENVKFNFGPEYLPCADPKWVYNDFAILFSTSNDIYYSVLSKENYKSGELYSKSLIHSSLVNGLTKDVYDRFYYSAFKKEFSIVSLDLELKYDIRKKKLEEFFYYTEILEYNEETKIAKIKRERKTIPQGLMANKSGDGYIEKKETIEAHYWLEELGTLHIYLESHDKFGVDKVIISSWPENIKKRKINVNVDFSKKGAVKDIRK